MLGKGDINADTPAKFKQKEEGFYTYVVKPLATHVGIKTSKATYPSAAKKAHGKEALSVTHEGRVEAVVRSAQSGASDSGDGDHRDTPYISRETAIPLLQAEFGCMELFKLMFENYKELTDTWLTTEERTHQVMAHINEWYTIRENWVQKQQ